MTNQENPQLISYTKLRKAVGILGITFPIILALGAVLFSCCGEIEKSISIYYHTIMRNFFVGVLCAIALFLFTYRGYELADNIAGNLAAIFALGVAFFPTAVKEPLYTSCISLLDNGIIGVIHLVSAVLFFMVLSYFCLFLFTKSKGVITARKKTRNTIYITCGIVMLASLALIAIYMAWFQEKYPSWGKAHPTFWLESISLWAFGISWLVKGEAILADK